MADNTITGGHEARCELIYRDGDVWVKGCSRTDTTKWALFGDPNLYQPIAVCPVHAAKARNYGYEKLIGEADDD